MEDGCVEGFAEIGAVHRAAALPGVCGETNLRKWKNDDFLPAFVILYLVIQDNMYGATHREIINFRQLHRFVSKIEQN